MRLCRDWLDEIVQGLVRWDCAGIGWRWDCAGSPMYWHSFPVCALPPLMLGRLRKRFPVNTQQWSTQISSRKKWNFEVPEINLCWLFWTHIPYFFRCPKCVLNLLCSEYSHFAQGKPDRHPLILWVLSCILYRINFHTNLLLPSKFL